MATMMVDVNLCDFDDDDLIDELEERGYRVVEDDEYVPGELTSEEITVILDRFQMSLPGTIGYDIYEKLRKR
jgi:hypothetical protein